MKTFLKSNIFAIILVIMTIGYTSCKKLDESKDYRAKWVGAYECSKSNKGDKAIVDVVAKGDSMLNITERDLQADQYGYYERGVRYDMLVDTDGNFKRVIYEHESIKPHVEGSFFQDSLYILHVDPAPGYTSYISYRGKKQK
ncbi:MAG: hypothetical protein ACOXZK_09635 [Bacteroidales bacterium]